MRPTPHSGRARWRTKSPSLCAISLLCAICSADGYEMLTSIGQIYSHLQPIHYTASRRQRLGAVCRWLTNALPATWPGSSCGPPSSSLAGLSGELQKHETALFPTWRPPRPPRLLGMPALTPQFTSVGCPSAGTPVESRRFPPDRRASDGVTTQVNCGVNRELSARPRSMTSDS